MIDGIMLSVKNIKIPYNTIIICKINNIQLFTKNRALSFDLRTVEDPESFVVIKNRKGFIYKYGSHSDKN